MSTHQALSRSGFAAHEKFLRQGTFADGRSRGLARRCPAERTAVFGASAGGELAPRSLGFGIHMSTVRSSAPRLAAVTIRLALCRARLPRTYLVAGTEEPFFPRETQGGGADALREAGCGCRHE